MGEVLFGLGTNIVSSIIFEIGKHFFPKNARELTEQELLNIIASSLSEANEHLTLIQNENEIILKLLLSIFDSKKQISIEYTPYGGYKLNWNCDMADFQINVKGILQDYMDNIPQRAPISLSQAIWPISPNDKELIFDELFKSINEEC